MRTTHSNALGRTKTQVPLNTQYDLVKGHLLKPFVKHVNA